MQKGSNKLIANIVSLYLSQGLNYVLPLILFPYLVRALGIQNYGVFVVAQTLGFYAQAICDYGFTLGGTAEVSVHRNNRSELSRIIASTLAAKIILGCIASVLLLLIGRSIPAVASEFNLLVVMISASIVTSFFPTWIYQGLEEMKIPAIISAITRTANIISILIFVKSADDMFLLGVINLLIAITFTAAGWIFICRKKQFSLGIPIRESIKIQLKKHFPIFISQVGVLVFSNAGVVLLGKFSTPEQVGMYSISEKIIKAILQFGAPIGTAIFPRMANIIKTEPRKALNELQKGILYGGVFFSLVCIILNILSGLIFKALEQDNIDYLRLMIIIMSPLCVTVFLDNIYGTQILLNAGHKKAFMLGTWLSGSCNLLLQLLLIPDYHALGAAISFSVSGICILIYFLATTKYYGYQLFPIRHPLP